MHRWILALLCCAATSIAAIAIQESFGIVVQVSGVCNPDPYGIKCFTTTGVVDPKLTKEIRDFFEAHPEHPLRLEYHHRDKLIVVRHDKRHDLDGETTPRFAMADGTTFPAMIKMPRKPTDDVATDLYWYYPPATQSTIALTYLTTTALSTVTIPARVGASASFGPYTMTITSISPLTHGDISKAGSSAERPMWMIEYRLSGIDASESTFSARVELFDKNGEVIRTVDRTGKPSATAADSPAQGAELAVPLQNGWATWVDPDEVGQLVVRPSVTVATKLNTALGPY